MAQSVKLPVACPGRASVSARCAPHLRVGSCPMRAPAARRFLPPAAHRFLPDARPTNETYAAAAAATLPPLSRLRLLLWGEGEGVADVFQQQPPPTATPTAVGEEGEGVAGVKSTYHRRTCHRYLCHRTPTVLL
ncbi:unnamed protein product [Closterium sp. NIES-54]